MQISRFQVTLMELPPVGLAYVAAAVRDGGHWVTMIDAIGEAPYQSIPVADENMVGHGLSIDQIIARVPSDTEVLGFSCMFSQDWPYNRDLIGALRRSFPGACLVAGGEHITALPEFVLEDSDLDHCVVGEGEETFLELLEALSQGRSTREVAGLVSRVDREIVRTPHRPRIRELDSLPRPAWDLFPIENYQGEGHQYGIYRGRCMPVIASRGCPYQCSFCSSTTMWTNRWIARDPAEVLDEIRDYLERYDVRNIDFHDLTAILKKQWILDFCRLIKESGLEFTWQLPVGTRSEAIDAEVAAALYETGCRNVTYAPESGSVSELERINKKIRPRRMLRSMRDAYKSGLVVKANFVLGFPGVTMRELLETMRFIAGVALVGARDVLIFLFDPYPGSPLYRQLLAEGRIPPPSDPYFAKLSVAADYTRAISYCDHSARTLNAMRVSGMVLFYTLCFAIRPWRIFQTVYRMWRGRYETHLEARISALLRDFAPRGRRREPTARMGDVTLDGDA
jgi:radical SAM superfamily enzyme YgiQ (UPF0313 family)